LNAQAEAQSVTIKVLLTTSDLHHFKFSDFSIQIINLFLNSPTLILAHAHC